MKKLLEEKGTGGKRIGAWPFVEVSGLDKRTPGHRIRVTLHARRASFRSFGGETHARRIWMSASLVRVEPYTHLRFDDDRPRNVCYAYLLAPCFGTIRAKKSTSWIDLFIFSTFSSFQLRIISTYLSSNYKWLIKCYCFYIISYILIIYYLYLYYDFCHHSILSKKISKLIFF